MPARGTDQMLDRPYRDCMGVLTLLLCTLRPVHSGDPCQHPARPLERVEDFECRSFSSTEISEHADGERRRACAGLTAPNDVSRRDLPGSALRSVVALRRSPACPQKKNAPCSGRHSRGESSRRESPHQLHRELLAPHTRSHGLAQDCQHHWVRTAHSR